MTFLKAIIGIMTEDTTRSSNGGQLPALQSKEHRDLLDIVDRLRLQGLSRYIDLPQIIVCGDQSSGKSSALEAISGLSFPTKDNLCTRFAIELILRRVNKTSDDLDISIIPGPERNEQEKARLQKFAFRGAVTDLDLASVIEDAKAAMGIGETSKVFSTDILRVEISGPSQPHLTIVDLPGLFLAGNKDQSEQDAALVEQLVLSYMKNERTIILAVVSAKNDFALQQITKHTRRLDPQGNRTLGLITKPDTLDPGSDSERFYIELAQNLDVKFRLGWHVLRNRKYAERHSTSAERDAVEAEFFSKGAWTSLKPSQKGVAALRLRLSHVLREHISKQLPRVIDDVNEGVQECKDTLARLGSPRNTTVEQRRYLMAISTSFTDVVKAAINGDYNTSPLLATSPQWRIRAVVQNTLTRFAREMHVKGHERRIIDESLHVDQLENGSIWSLKFEDDGLPPAVSMEDYMEEVKQLLQETRGRELPGTYNPLIVSELFGKQARPWKGMVSALLNELFSRASDTVEAILRDVADTETADRLLQLIVKHKLEEIKQDLNKKAEEILKPHIFGHPITYNHYLISNVQEIQTTRNQKNLEEKLKDFFETNKMDNTDRMYQFKMTELLSALAEHTERDMERYSCTMAIDMMQAYYKVSHKLRRPICRCHDEDSQLLFLTGCLEDICR